jgi:hypothetical protein
MMWSNPDAWINVFDEARVPEEGDEVEILIGMNIIYDADLGTSPVLKNLEINGKLSF